MTSDEENELLIAHDLLQSEVIDSERKIRENDADLLRIEEKLAKNQIIHTTTLEALESLAGSKIVALAAFKALTKELHGVNELQKQHFNSRSRLLQTKNELTVGLHQSQIELEQLEQRIEALRVAEDRKVLEFKKP